jgi:hypothetical protein
LHLAFAAAAAAAAAVVSAVVVVRLFSEDAVSDRDVAHAS